MLKISVWENEWIDYEAKDIIEIKAGYVDGGKYGIVYCDGVEVGWLPSCNGVTVKIHSGKLQGLGHFCLKERSPDG